MIDYRNLTKLQIDGLREVGNIGAGHAATALSQVIESTIMIKVSSVDIIPLQNIHRIVKTREAKVVCVSLQVLGDIIGGILLLFDWSNALALADILKAEKPGISKILTERDESALKEAGSILSAAYLKAIGKFLNFTLIPSLPSLEIECLYRILEGVFKQLTKRAEIAFCIQTQFVEEDSNITGNFLLIPEINGLEKILKAMGIENY
jgi:chemotaxis protein CheC